MAETEAEYIPTIIDNEIPYTSATQGVERRYQETTKIPYSRRAIRAQQI